MDWNDFDRAMVVFAHPDDAEFGCAGTVAKLVAAGKTVVYVVVTDGSKGSSDPEMTPERLNAIRVAEQCRAAEILGVSHVEFLNFEDGMLQPTLDLRRAISREIRRHKPDVLVAQSPVRDLTGAVFPQHPDHLATGEATMAAVYPSARDRLSFPELLDEGLEPHAVREMWVVSLTQPDYFVDITDTIDRKIAALKAHESQVGHRDIEEFVPQRARQLGAEQGMEMAEAFRRIEIP